MTEPESVSLLSVTDMLAGDDTQFEVIDVPEWGGSVRIGSLSAEQMVKWTETKTDTPESRRVAGILIFLMSIVDGAGNRIGNATMVAAFKKRQAVVLNRIVERILKLNGLVVKDGIGPSLDLVAVTDRKNGSGETMSVVSPTA